MKKAIAGLLVGLFLFGLLAGGSGVRQLHDEIHSIQQQWVAINASPPDEVSVAQARALWLHTQDLQRRYEDNPRVKAWENRAWNTYREYLRRYVWAS